MSLHSSFIRFQFGRTHSAGGQQGIPAVGGPENCLRTDRFAAIWPLIMSTAKPLTLCQLRDDLDALGIMEGDVLIVHSSLSRIGWVEGRPEDVVRMIIEALGPLGTLVMPTFSFSLAAWDMPVFEPWATASRVGVLTDVFWRMREAVRSAHPTHSVAAAGPLAEKIIGGPVDYQPLGLRSPLDRARRAGAKILLAGVGNDRNSMVHVAESVAGAPYLKLPFEENSDFDTAYYRESALGSPVLTPIREMPGSSEGFSILDDALLAAGIAKQGVFGEARAMVMEAKALTGYVVDLLKRQPDAFLHHPDASEITRRRLQFIVSLGKTRRSLRHKSS